ncbi:hypothetical protein Fot_05482 [Forsythia ovata]|uniref:Uncharacterized protein n=1 Tax=Forsythia ovata TaxID=205694 RepID=A0ABD1WQA9_9LAMI
MRPLSYHMKLPTFVIVVLEQSSDNMPHVLLSDNDGDSEKCWAIPGFPSPFPPFPLYLLVYHVFSDSMSYATPIPAIEEKPEQTRRNRGKPEQTQTPEQRGPLGRRQRRVNRWRRRRQRRVNHQNSEGHSDGDRGASIGGEDGDRGVNGGSPGSVDF